VLKEPKEPMFVNPQESARLAADRTQYAPLFTLGSRTLRTFVWQPDLHMVVWYIYDCFQVCARILSPCVAVPSNQP
jgi:hypothetical protein